VRSVFNDEKKLSIACPNGSSNRHAVVGHQLLELLAGVLAATVGMMQHSIGFAPVARSPSPGHR
jgi:hypothetical protein